MKLKSLFVICLSALTLACQKNDPVFTRENDTISCDCKEQSIEQNLLCSGEWHIDYGDVDWIKSNPESGKGNGVDYQFFTLNIKYNSGEERVGVINIVHNGKSYPVTITQGACEFKYGTIAFTGNLFQNIECEKVTIDVPYYSASGYEEVDVKCTITGSASEGISVKQGKYSGFVKGDGVLSIPVEGTPLKSGQVTFELFIDNINLGTCKAKVLADPDLLPAGLPAGWNFYETVDGVEGTAVRGSAYDYSWTSDALNPVTAALPTTNHIVMASSGNKSAKLTASSSTVTNYSFNPSIQIRGMVKDDYFLMIIPVKNIGADTKVTVEASTGAAGSAAGFYVLEYSSDNKTWNMAPGYQTMEVFGASSPVHFNTPSENCSTERKVYDKSTDKGYKKYTFALTGIDTIKDGNLYFRLRISLDRRAIGSETTNTIGSNTWADLKGFEVNLVEEEEE